METVTRKWSDISRKVIFAVVGAIAAGTATASGMDQVILWFWSVFKAIVPALPDMPATVATIIGTVLGAAIGGYLPKEKLAPTAMMKPESGSVLRSPPVATALAFGGALAVIFFLSGCAPAARPGLPPAPNAALSQHIATARTYVTLAEAAADTCVVLRIPFCTMPATLEAIKTGKAVAEEALAEAQRQADEGQSASLVQTTLRVAMNAVLLFYSLKPEEDA
ncbi:hypothetical protein FFK22_008735 [Mycobacterium sp. KBS0706]|uniref:hypothetical protein n=1 Tax=Mycobacterium sp. KBS0706 TaxID=2578109 RepID=UPI00117EE1DC|nr:hypothetical protein [Mycobacterium sp. KBS0706]TSD89058.1 hypothetical protein FFK22_008735 [Mycobacterium sp. KBS0706]